MPRADGGCLTGSCKALHLQSLQLCIPSGPLEFSDKNRLGVFRWEVGSGDRKLTSGMF